MLLSKFFLLSITVLLILSLQQAVAEKTQDPVPAEKLGKSEYCGLCHTEIYQQWNASSHHFSSFNNPIYRKVILSEVGTEDEKTLRFCAGCHDPLLAASNQLSPLDVDSWPANSGITCLSPNDQYRRKKTVIILSTNQFSIHLPWQITLHFKKRMNSCWI